MVHLSTYRPTRRAYFFCFTRSLPVFPLLSLPIVPFFPHLIPSYVTALSLQLHALYWKKNKLSILGRLGLYRRAKTLNWLFQVTQHRPITIHSNVTEERKDGQTTHAGGVSGLCITSTARLKRSCMSVTHLSFSRQSNSITAVDNRL